jgi:hypothetical protein
VSLFDYDKSGDRIKHEPPATSLRKVMQQGYVYEDNSLTSRAARRWAARYEKAERRDAAKAAERTRPGRGFG